ncbi:MAG: AmpG family muropeptide MFS transporter [Oligoflexia bacterium]|nr:AmpG family muropeptide MFS transporter [Oligoflexia bacterium]
MSVLKLIKTKRMWITGLLGFGSGLPLLLTGSTLQAWLTDDGVSLSLIGAATLLGLPYTLKFLWAPFLDRFSPPILKGRRGWIVTFQILTALALIGLSTCRPKESLWGIVIVSFLITFFSASQDIVVDAYRRELLPKNELGLGSSFYVFGYRVALLIAGAFALFLADQMAWPDVYIIMGVLMGAMIIVTVWSPQPTDQIQPPKSISEAVIQPFKDYLSRRGATEILVFILFYKLGDNMALAMTTPYVLKLGYTKTEYAALAKTVGLAALIVGGFVGAALMEKLDMKKSLFYFGVLQALSTAAFSILVVLPLDRTALASVMIFENLTAGMGSTAFSAFMLGITTKKFSGTQFALLSSLMGVPRVIFSSYTGVLAENLGWFWFFLTCSFVAAPGILMVLRFDRWQKESVNP